MKAPQAEYLSIAQGYMPLFHQQKEQFFFAVAGCQVPLQIMEMAYDRLARAKRITDLYDLSPEEQDYAKEKAKEYAAGRKGVSLKQIVKTIILVNYFLNLEN